MTHVIDTLDIRNLDEHRYEMDLLAPEDDTSHGYYGCLLCAMECILVRRNILSLEEIEKRVEGMRYGRWHWQPVHHPGHNWPQADEDKVRWGAWRKEEQMMPGCTVGYRVWARNIHPLGHTRVTHYTRGKIGNVTIVNDQAWVLPDARALYRGENLQAVYNVRSPAEVL